jgi:prepilin-type processing-associated H-X9-DG protein
MTNRRSYSLIELLAVIAMLAVLGAILFAVFSPARKKAVQVRDADLCPQNLGLVAKAALQYAADYDDRWVPSSIDPGNTGQARLGFAVLLSPYLTGGATFLCPGDPNPKAPPSGGYLSGPGNLKTSYLLNDHLSARRLEDVKELMRTVSFMCGGVRTGTTEAGYPPMLNVDCPLKPSSYLLADPRDRANRGATDDPDWAGPAPRHYGKISVAWVDGHSSLCPLEWYMYDGRWLDPSIEWFPGGYTPRPALPARHATPLH